MVVADLHIHTQNSDGTLQLQDLPSAARRANLTAVAVTDHDRLHPQLEAPVTTRDGITIIHGIELRVEAEERIDLLGYGVEPTAELRELTEHLQANRITRGAAIIEQVESYLEIDLDIEPQPGIGRPHIARAIASHPDTTHDIATAFEELIGDGRPCYVPREIPSFEEGRRILTDACAVVGLAHPSRYDDPDTVLELSSRLDAIERWYPYEHPVDPTPVEHAVTEHELLRTGGSDTHDQEVGRTGMPNAAYEAFAAHLPD